MIKIRSNVFETNSSSVHSICISKDKVEYAPTTVCLNFEEYEWNCGSYSAKDYLWTAILLLKSYNYDEKKKEYNYKRIPEIENHIREVLYKYGVKRVVFKYPKRNNLEPEDSWYKYEEEPSIDHDCETEPFVDACLENDDLLARTILGASFVYTGNDNSCDDDNMCFVTDPDAIWWEDEYKPNPEYDPDKYDYFMKGN